MILRSLASLRLAAFLSALLAVTACDGDRPEQLSAVQTIDVPAAGPGAQANQNIANPTLEIPVTYPVKDGDELTLVWSDEFDGPEIDPGTWFFATGDGSEVGLPGGWGNNELQYYLPDNAMIVNGVLEITARRETVGDLSFTSARINTQDRFAFKYGRIEASIKMPGGQGLWPAFWMLSQDSDYLCSGDPCVWAAIGEIDIVEAVNLDGTGGNEIFATIHYGDEFPANQSTESRFTPSVDVTETFNTYALEWDVDEIRWYFNGELYAMQPSSVWFSAADNAGPNGPFDQNFHILLNLAVGGDFPGSPNGTTPWPVTMEVDWVRVYSGEPPPAGAGDVPENAVFVTDPNVTADLAGVLDNFGSGATFNQFYAGDPDFKPTLQVTSGNAYENNPDVGFVAFTLYDAGFAADFETLSFKVKGLPGDELEIKFFGSPENSIIINLSTYPGAVDIGNGWYQVTIPMSDFAANVYAFTGFLIGPPGDQGAPFSFLLTDIGFDGSIVTTPADAGTTPDVTVYARGGVTDLVENENFTVSGFDSGSLFNRNNTGDVDFSPAFSVTTGDGYTVQVGQLAFLGFGAGFAVDYLTLDFKVKGMNNDIIRLKLLEAAPSDYVDVTLTSSDFATALGNGWYQVSVPLETFGNAATADSLLFETGGEPPADAFTFLLNDIGFSGTTLIPATGGLVPDATILESDGSAADLTSTFTGFDSGTGTAIVADSSYAQALEVTVANGYAPTLALAQLFITGLSSLDSYDEFLFKVKGLTDNNLVMKIEPPQGGPAVAINLAAPGAGITVEALGDGWSQVVVDLTPFGDLSGATLVILQTLDNAYAVGDTFLLTDIGFNTPGGGTATGGSVPDATILESDGSAADLTSTFTGFDSGTGTAIVADSSYAQALEVTVANGYAPTLALAQLFITGLSSLDSYDEFLFKVKGLTDNNLVMKIEPPQGGPAVAINLAAPGAGITVEALGDGWSQVVVDLTPFGDLSGATLVILQTLDNAYAVGDTFLLTDIGFNTPGGGTATGGSVPDATILESDGSAADLTSTFTGFDSGTGTAIVADSSYAQALEVTVANGYAPTLALAQLFITGLSSLDSYDEFLFKVKGLTDNNLVMKIEPPQGGPAVAINLAAPGAGITVEALGDGWSQVVVDLTPFGDLSGATLVILQTLDNAYAVGDTFLLTDIGFNTPGGGTATGGSVPDATILESDGSAADLTSTFTGFDSGTGTAIVADSSYAQALEVTVANGYAPTLALAQLFITGLSSLDSYDEFLFKVKGLTDNNLVMKIEPPQGGPAVAINLAAPGAGITVEALGDGWSQVVVDLTPFGDLSGATLVILQTLDNAYAVGDTFLLTDIGFNTPGGGGNGGTGAATGELVLNGDFEDGLNGWVFFDSSNSAQGGTITAGAPNSTFTTGSNSARIYSVGQGQFPLLKLERLSEGVLANGASVTVSFDWYNPVQTVDSTVGPIVGNNVVVVQLLTERAGDNGATTEDLIAPPTFLQAGPNWQQAAFDTNLGADAGGGVSLFFQTNTGGNANAEMELYIDNVSIVIN